MKVWICTQGEYSDASVAAVFSKEEDARTAEKLFGWDPEEVEVDAVDLTGMPPEPGVQPFRGSIRLDDPSDSSWNFVSPFGGPPTGWAPAGNEGLFSRIWFGSFWARDRQHALEIAKAKRDELLGGGS